MKTKVIASFIFAGILTGALITLQLKSPVPISSEFPADQLDAQRDLIKSFSDEQSLLKSQIVALRTQIEENQTKNTSIAKISNLDVLSTLKEKIGLTSVTGPGVSIILNDGHNTDRGAKTSNSDALIHASDLRDIINLLRVTKPKAIAINKQRIINSSPITAVGNSILINNSRQLPPFKIDVVGDSAFIEQLFKTSNIVKALKVRQEKFGISFTVNQIEEQTVPLYNGDLILKYLTVSAQS